ncbi:hypothetical protein [Coleofasciculus sp. F4-SAH-05]|uniref:hypothetical protein n=1 Tax=Coleofasciculus sp. F4-SAH-05 TaxID=3069525 RepID=UPI0032FE4863
MTRIRLSIASRMAPERFSRGIFHSIVESLVICHWSFVIGQVAAGVGCVSEA